MLSGVAAASVAADAVSPLAGAVGLASRTMVSLTLGVALRRRLPVTIRSLVVVEPSLRARRPRLREVCAADADVDGAPGEGCAAVAFCFRLFPLAPDSEAAWLSAASDTARRALRGPAAVTFWIITIYVSHNTKYDRVSLKTSI